MKHALIICSLLISYFSFAQNNIPSDDISKIGTINGKVIDQSLKQPIPYATVAIKSGEKVIKGGITNEDGSFELKQIKAGSYTVEVQFIGYQTYHKNIQITAQNPKHNLGTIGL